VGAARIVRLLGVAAGAALVLGFGRGAAAETTVDFEQFEPGTVLTSQYADQGGTGQGVVFGPLPAGSGVGEGLKPVVRTPPAGQAQSGTRIADFATCFACEFFTPRTTGTFGTPRSSISVRVGYLGEPAICLAVEPTVVGCAVITLRAFDRNGALAAEASVRVTRGAGIHSLLTVSTPTATIVGFELSARPSTDDSKQVAMDDLTFATPAAPPPPPDFTLNPARTSVLVEQGATVSDAITIGRLNGSSGPIGFGADGLPAGVHATFTPEPSTGSQTVLTLSADPKATPAHVPVRITATPQAASAGSQARSFDLDLTVQPTCKRVSTREELVAAVNAGFTCIFVVDRAEIDLTAGEGEVALKIPDGVTLMGGRSPTVAGGLLFQRERVDGRIAMLDLGKRARVTGLRIRGYNHLNTKDVDDPTKGLLIRGVNGVVVENNEIFDWPAAGVEVLETPGSVLTVPRVTRNYIHHNVQCNLGYGVVVGDDGFALIDRNVFDFNRHDIAGSGGPGQSYIAELNFVLTTGPTCGGFYNQHFDMHGEHGGYGGRAGDLMDIKRNTIRGAQHYAFNGRLVRPAFELRGTPTIKALFTNNAVVHSSGLKQSSAFGKTISSSGAVRTQGVSAIPLLLKKKLVIQNNQTCVDTAKELAVGDFNGDRRADVFQSVGTLWAYSPSGRREWQFLNASTVRLGALGLGDFDGDGKTDVFTSSGGRWHVFSGGVGNAKLLPAGSNIDIRQFRFADFDGDGKTDVFRANGSRFFLSSAGATPWQPLAASRLKLGDLRFGDFDGDGKTDVFSFANGQWSVSNGGVGAWRRLNAKIGSDLGSLLFADFDGDRRTDVARASGGRWQVSSGGTTPWKTLQFGRSESLASGMLAADFTGDGRADVLQFGKRGATPTAVCTLLAGGDPLLQSFEHYRLSEGGARPLDRWSVNNMR
jgi:hypothetical protein